MSKIFRPNHNFARECVPKKVVGVLDKLVSAGFEAYLVGGSVRDILLGMEPKDFDIATSAHPEQVKKVFRNCRLIGRRFKLAHIFFGRDIIEVATFRASADDAESLKHDADTHSLSSSGQIMRDNIYGNLEQDALRRDLSVNSLYYDWQQDCVIDYHDGMQDIKDKIIRIIGEPSKRYQEDPVRILRAVRFTVKLGFVIEASSENSIYTMSKLLGNIPEARLFEEFLKMFQYGFASEIFVALEKYDLLKFLFSQTTEALAEDRGEFRKLVVTALADTDQRVANHERTTPAYLLAVLLWGAVRKYVRQCDKPLMICMHQASKKTLMLQRKNTSIPKRFALMAQNMWELQPRLSKIKGKAPFKVLENPKFRAAYDFLLLRHRAGEPDLKDLSEWWTKFQHASVSQRRKMAGFKEKQKPIVKEHE